MPRELYVDWFIGIGQAKKSPEFADWLRMILNEKINVISIVITRAPALLHIRI